MRRRQVTLHLCRRFVKTTKSDLWYSDFSEYFIGLSRSACWTKKDSGKIEIFRRAISNISKHSSTRKTRSRYTKQHRRTQSNIKAVRQSERWCHIATIRSAYGFNNKNAEDWEQTTDMIVEWLWLWFWGRLL